MRSVSNRKRCAKYTHADTDCFLLLKVLDEECVLRYRRRVLSSSTLLCQVIVTIDVLADACWVTGTTQSNKVSISTDYPKSGFSNTVSTVSVFLFELLRLGHCLFGCVWGGICRDFLLLFVCAFMLLFFHPYQLWMHMSMRNSGQIRSMVDSFLGRIWMDVFVCRGRSGAHVHVRIRVISYLHVSFAMSVRQRSYVTVLCKLESCLSKWYSTKISTRFKPRHHQLVPETGRSNVF